jgi:hypothetical protein
MLYFSGAMLSWLANELFCFYVATSVDLQRRMTGWWCLFVHSLLVPGPSLNIFPGPVPKTETLLQLSQIDRAKCR